MGRGRDEDGDRDCSRPALSTSRRTSAPTLNKALEAIEDANVDALQDVLKGTSTSTGRSASARSTTTPWSTSSRTLTRSRCKDEDFEFPDLLGAAYEWLIKYFADSAGKKAGEFYTPAEVVRVCVEICDPQEGMRIYDPTVGSGGMLIQTRDYLRENGGDADEHRALRPGEDRHHLVDLQDEHAAARHLRTPTSARKTPSASRSTWMKTTS